MAIGRDITERKKAAEQQALFASIVNSSEDAIISTTTEGIINSWNRGAELLFNYPAAEIIGKNIEIIVPPQFAEKMIWFIAESKMVNMYSLLKHSEAKKTERLYTFRFPYRRKEQ